MGKTHKHLKAFASTFLVGAMLFASLCIFASPVTALAAGEENQLEIVVPIEVVFTVDSNGKVAAPTNWQITNNSEKDYILDGVRAGSQDVPVSIKAALPSSAAGDDWFSIENMSFKLSKNFVELAAGTALNVNWSLNDGNPLDKSVLEQFKEGTNKLSDFTFSYIPAESKNWPAFAVVYQDGTAGLYKRDIDPSEISKNSLYDGRRVEEVILDIENKEGIFKERRNLTAVRIADSGIRPKTTKEWFNECHKLRSIENLTLLNTFCVQDMFYMFHGCVALQELDVSHFDTTNVTNMEGMFSFCKLPKTLDVSGFDTSNVKSMANMFGNCISLTTLDVSHFDTSSVTDMGVFGMFGSCISLTTLDVSHFDTSSVTDMRYMFQGCASLQKLDLSRFNTSSVTNMANMFSNCRSLTTLDVSRFNTSNVTNMNGMFAYCASLQKLDLSHFDTSKVTNMSYMFNNCSLLESINISAFDTRKVTNMNGVFVNCESLKKLDFSRWNTFNVGAGDASSGVRADGLLSHCKNLQSVTIGSEWDLPIAYVFPVGSVGGIPFDYLYDRNQNSWRAYDIPLKCNPAVTYYTSQAFIPKATVSVDLDFNPTKSTETNVVESEDAAAPIDSFQLAETTLGPNSAADNKSMSDASNCNQDGNSNVSQGNAQGISSDNSDSSKVGLLESPPQSRGDSDVGCSVALPTSLN